MDSVLARLAFACPVEASHTVRPGPTADAIVSVCRACESHVRRVRDVMLVD